MEEWRDVVGYEGYYEVSDMGRVRSVGRWVKTACGIRFKKPHIMKPCVHPKTGYLTICLARDGAKENKTVHKLVALAFVENPHCYPQINHKNEVKSDNRADNLEWTTAKENTNYGTANKRRASRLSVVKCKPVAQIKDGTIINIFPSTLAAVVVTDPGHISSCALGKQPTAGGYVWKYI